MRINQLIGKKISDIRIEVKDYEYEGSIPLEISNSVIELESGEILGIPNRDTETVYLNPKTAKEQESIFYSSGFLSKILSSENQKLRKRNREKIKGKKIIGIYQYDEVEEDINQIEDYMLIEVESGFLIGEVPMAPKGTGSAGIWIFTSMEDLTKKIGDGFRKIY